MPAFSIARRCAPLALSFFALCGVPAASSHAASVAGASGVYANYLASRFAAARSDPDRAARAALRALSLAPAEPDLLKQAFLASALAGRPEALGLAHMLPRQEFALLMRADSAVQRGDWKEAAALVSALPGEGLAQALRPALLAWIAQGQGRTDEALGLLAPLAESGAFQAPFALHAGLIADLAGRPEEAARFFNQAQAAFGPLGLRQAEIIAGFQARHGHQAEAFGILDQAAVSNPELALVLPDLARHLHQPPVTSAAEGIAEAYVAAAGTLQQQGRADLAALLLRYALNLRPGFSTAQFLFADLYAAQNRVGEARAMLTAIPPGDPLRALVHLRDADLLHAAGDDASALNELDVLARTHPQSPLPLTRKADLLRKTHRLSEAAAAYNEAIARAGQTTPQSWVLFYDRAVVRDQMNDWPGAEADLRQALALAPDQVTVLNYLGYSWTDRGEHLDQARRMIERAAAAAPNDGAIIDSMGWVMLKQGDIAGAVRTLERATELMPADPTINGHLGDAYAAAGRKLEAGYQWQRALTLHPDADEARRLRLKLELGERQSATAQTPAFGQQ